MVALWVRSEKAEAPSHALFFGVRAAATTCWTRSAGRGRAHTASRMPAHSEIRAGPDACQLRWRGLAVDAAPLQAFVCLCLTFPFVALFCHVMLFAFFSDNI